MLRDCVSRFGSCEACPDTAANHRPKRQRRMTATASATVNAEGVGRVAATGTGQIIA